MASKVKLSLRGLEEAAKSSEMRDEIASLAEQVADKVRSQNIRVSGVPGDDELPVKVYVDETSQMRLDRAKARVSLAHPAGLAVQAKHGALTRAAAAVGLEVKSR